EELKYQIKSTRVSKQKQELMPFLRQSEEVVEDVDSEETIDEPPVRIRPTRVVIGGEVHNKSDDEGLDHSKKLKGLETLSEIAQFKLNMEKARRVHNELTLEVHDVTSKVLDKPSDHSSGSNSDSKFIVKDISSDEADIIEKAEEAKKAETEKDTDEQMIDEQVIVKQVVEEEHDDGQGGNEQVGDAQANVHMIEPLVEKPEATNKTKDQPTSSKKGTTPYKPSKPNKSMQADEIVEELDQEEAIDDEEPPVDEVVNTKEHPQDNVGLSQHRSKWFKQPFRPKTPNP
nr:hypothetical protein [Tanacetum cinerariifolium]